MPHTVRLFMLLLPLTLLLVSSSGPVRYHPITTLAAPSRGPVAPPSFGVNAHLATRYTDATTMHLPADVIAQLGVSWVREDFHWYRIQPTPEVWDWTFNDAAVHALRQRGINILGVFGPGVGWATPYPGDLDHDVSYYAPDHDLFLGFARAVVERYRHDIFHWEIWNEPDHPYFWRPHPDPIAYADFLMRTSAMIREIQPEATILIGGFNPFNTEFVRTVAAQGAWDSFDVLAIHPYVDPYTPEDGNLAAAIDIIHALTHEFGEKPIWATEIGWASGPGDRSQDIYPDEHEQANFLVRAMLLLWESGVERSFWYTLKDDPGNPYGLVAEGSGRADYRSTQYKPAFTAFRMLNRQIADVTFVERRDLFEPTSILTFDDMSQWKRPRQPNGTLETTEQASARLTYNFSTPGNDYVVFERVEPVMLPDDTHAIGIHIYGDGSDHVVNVWLEDAEGEILQFALGIVGVPGWRFISAPISYAVQSGNRIAGEGNGRLDMPARLIALTLDDARDSYIGTGTIYLDQLSVVTGREVYDLRFDRHGEALDIIWSPPGIRVGLNTTASHGIVLDRDGVTQQSIPAEHGRLSLTIPPGAPVYLWHTR